VDIRDQRRIEQFFRFLPELVPALALALRVHHQRCHQLQNVLLRVQIGERVVVHRLLEIDRVKNLDAVVVPHQDVPALLKNPDGQGFKSGDFFTHFAKKYYSSLDGLDRRNGVKCRLFLAGGYGTIFQYRTANEKFYQTSKAVFWRL